MPIVNYVPHDGERGELDVLARTSDALISAADGSAACVPYRAPLDAACRIESMPNVNDARAVPTGRPAHGAA
ncbi:hypothetical protein GXB81_25385 [Paraburkholderia sp. Ac-20336]|uniref:hypothetical protein n=1 Tax=Paraburkholderia sp. Ac-20336 TaxID=2703886 RepID=UPI00197F97C5|nr:hypothetical protein [Paraburkholderia sp. Ac-20336]MBN3806361.1 hypothetical protein [Paraburkholderia sp. Ac-20336]